MMIAAEIAKMPGSASFLMAFAIAGVRRSGCHELDRLRVQMVIAATSKARHKANKVKSIVFPA